MSPQLIAAQIRKLGCIRQVPIVGDANPMRKIRVKRLRFGTRARTGGGVTNVSQADVAPQIDHVMCLEHVLYEAVIFTEMEASAFGGDNAGGVLAAVLKDREAVEDALIDVGIFVC
jgi:hypothetical protein